MGLERLFSKYQIAFGIASSGRKLRLEGRSWRDEYQFLFGDFTMFICAATPLYSWEYWREDFQSCVR